MMMTREGSGSAATGGGSRTTMILLLWWWGTLVGVQAQVQSAGRFLHGSFATLMDLHQAPYRAPPINMAQIMARQTHEKGEEAAMRKPPYKFGEPVAMTVDMEQAGEWEISPDGRARVWRAMVQSPGAQSLGLIFDRFYLPEGAEFYVLGGNQTLGAFVGSINNRADGHFFTTPMLGDTLIMEYWEARDNAPALQNKILPDLEAHQSTQEQPSRQHRPLPTARRSVEIRVSGVVHGFRKFMESNVGYGNSGDCNDDVACPMGLLHRDSINAVGMVIMNTGWTCTGVLLNNPRQDGRQLFLTADHCIHSWMRPSQFLVAFNYQHVGCASEGEPVNGEPEMQTVGGMRVLARWAETDFALLEILEDIPDSYNAFYAGWNRAAVAPRDVSTIHHPSGDVKKISLFQGNTTITPLSDLFGPYYWHVEAWTRGVTEPGSSGAPLFDHLGRAVGHLYGGTSSCFNQQGFDMYGALAYDWATAGERANWAQPFLDPDGKNVTSITGSYYRHRKQPIGGKRALQPATIDLAETTESTTTAEMTMPTTTATTATATPAANR